MLLTILVLALAPSVSWAQAPQDSWENLKKLDAGHKIKIVDMSLKSWAGRLVGVSEESITIRAKEGEVTVARADVLRVTDLERSKRGRNALIGFAIGTVVGAAMVANEGDLVPWGKAVIAVGFFGGPGAAAGALIPYLRPTLYRAAQQPRTTGGVLEREPVSVLGGSTDEDRRLAEGLQPGAAAQRA